MSADSANLPTDGARDRWFAAEVHAHEPILRAWLRSRFPTFHDVDDVVQEAYLRVLTKFDKNGEPESAKALLFCTARNLVLDHLRHRNVERLNPLAEVDNLPVIDGNADVPEAVARQQELDLLIHAIQSLPKRCRQVITLRKIYGLSQKEVAAKLGIAEHTVEAQGTIGIRKMAAYFDRCERGAQIHP
jgi:RNA polymerase sigma factor (sigma-70 family)